MIARLGTMFERTADVRDQRDLEDGAGGRLPHHRRSARLPRRGGERLPAGLRRHAHLGRGRLGGVGVAAGGQELAARDLGAAARRALRAPRRVLRSRRRVRLGRPRRGELRAEHRGERGAGRLDRRGRPVRAAARPQGTADRSDLGRRARDRAPADRRGARRPRGDLAARRARAADRAGHRERRPAPAHARGHPRGLGAPRGGRGAGRDPPGGLRRDPRRARLRQGGDRACAHARRAAHARTPPAAGTWRRTP